MAQSNARRYRRTVQRLPQNRHRYYTAWHYVYRILRALNMKRLTWHLFRRTRVLWTEWAFIPGRPAKLLRTETLTSPRIGVIVENKDRAADTTTP